MFTPSHDIQFEDFLKVDIRVGTILDAEPNPKAKKPAYLLTIDFGHELGVKKSSAQITKNYTPAELVGKQIVAVTNFPVKRIAGVKSEVLVLACVDEAQGGVVLLQPSHPTSNGCRVL